MKITRETKQWIERETDKYSRRIGLSKFQRPILVYTRKELEQVKDLTELTTKIEVAMKSCYGVTYFDQYRNLITYINMKKHKDFKDLTDTVVHELAHIRFPNMRFKHTKKFNRTVDAIIKGKRFKPE
jgi:predicted metal-dependent hydrolase